MATVVTRPGAVLLPLARLVRTSPSARNGRTSQPPNPDIVNDPVAIAAANAVMIQMIAKGEITAEMTPQSRWQKVADATKKRLGIVRQPSP